MWHCYTFEKFHVGTAPLGEYDDVQVGRRASENELKYGSKINSLLVQSVKIPGAYYEIDARKKCNVRKTKCEVKRGIRYLQKWMKTLKMC